MHDLVAFSFVVADCSQLNTPLVSPFTMVDAKKTPSLEPVFGWFILGYFCKNMAVQHGRLCRVRQEDPFPLKMPYTLDFYLTAKLTVLSHIMVTHIQVFTSLSNANLYTKYVMVHYPSALLEPGCDYGPLWFSRFPAGQ